MPVYECPTCRIHVTCASPEDAPYRPFCSERCKLIDLSRWLNEEYRISEPAPEGGEDEPNRQPPDATSE
jgi:hypothetical protein